MDGYFEVWGEIFILPFKNKIKKTFILPFKNKIKKHAIRGNSVNL